jgi:hypothetical protein
VRETVTDAPRWPRRDADDPALQPAAVGVDLAGHLLVRRQHGLERVLGGAELDHHVAVGRGARALRRLLDDARDDVALAAGVLAVGQRALRLAQALQDDLLGGARGDAAEALGRVVVLAQDAAVLAELLRQHGDLAARAVELDAGVRLRALGVAVGGEQRRRSRDDESNEISFSRSTPRSAVCRYSRGLLSSRLSSMVVAGPFPCGWNST